MINLPLCIAVSGWAILLLASYGAISLKHPEMSFLLTFLFTILGCAWEAWMSDNGFGKYKDHDG